MHVHPTVGVCTATMILQSWLRGSEGVVKGELESAEG